MDEKDLDILAAGLFNHTNQLLIIATNIAEAANNAKLQTERLIRENEIAKKKVALQREIQADFRLRIFGKTIFEGWL